LHLVGAQATGANVNPFGGAVNHHFDALGVRLPLAIGSYMRMAVLLAEANAFSANIAFGHDYPPFNFHDYHSTKPGREQQQAGIKKMSVELY